MFTVLLLNLLKSLVNIDASASFRPESELD